MQENVISFVFARATNIRLSSEILGNVNNAMLPYEKVK